jgi:hypothetical protein
VRPLLAILLGACGSADIADGTVRCGAAGACPPGFRCGADERCYRSGGLGADGAVDPDGVPPIDGPPDAPPDAPVDAPPVPCTTDAECDAMDSMCGDWYCDLTVNMCRGNPVNQGVMCAARSCPGAWSACSGDGSCNETGTQTRTCSDFLCQGIYCAAANVVESAGCPIDTDGNSCGSDFCNGYPGNCPNDLADECDQDGTRSRNCYARRCGGGACGDVFLRTESEGCTRPTEGNACGAVTVCGPWDSDDFDCSPGCGDERSCTDYTCMGGGCAGGAPRTETGTCTNFETCGIQHCSCGDFPRICNPSGVCVNEATCISQCS